MGLPFGINCRASSGYVTDGATEDMEDANNGASPSYSHTGAHSGVVFGTLHNSSWDSRDRDSGNDRRLAGALFNNGIVSSEQVRIDLPASVVGVPLDIRFAAGDPNGSINVNFELYDDTVLLATLTSGTTSGANTFKDATNTEYTNITWPGSNTAITKTFNSTNNGSGGPKCFIQIPIGGGAVNAFNHISFAVSGGAGSTLTVNVAD